MPEFGNVVDDLFLWIAGAVGHQHRAERTDHRLGDRHRGVLAIVLEHAEVAFIHNGSLVPDHDAIRVGRIQGLAPGEGLGSPHRQYADCVDARVKARRQGQGRAQPAGNIDSGHQLAKFGYAPAHGREAKIAAVLKAQGAVGRRRCADHPLWPGRVAGLRIRE